MIGFLTVGLFKFQVQVKEGWGWGFGGERRGSKGNGIHTSWPMTSKALVKL